MSPAFPLNVLERLLRFQIRSQHSGEISLIQRLAHKMLCDGKRTIQGANSDEDGAKVVARSGGIGPACNVESRPCLSIRDAPNRMTLR